MQVKCPKCRFRYDVPVTPGAKELACVCQRCGLPFTYVMTEEEQQSVHQEVVSAVGGGSAASYNNTPQSVSSGGSNSQQPISSYGGTHGEGNAPSSSPAGGYNGGANSQRPYGMGQGRGGAQAPLIPPRRKGGCMRNCFVIFLVILAIVAFTVRMCLSDRSYTSDDIQDDDTEMTLGDQNSSEMNRISDNPFAGINAEKAPKWLEGNWAVTTRNGSITITIRGNKIAESSNGQHSSGTFIYERGKLHCDFRDGEDNVRRVDEQNHRIDAGDGAWMHKTDYSDER